MVQLGRSSAAVAPADWLKDVAAQPAASIARTVRATGLLDKHLGPSWQYAQVEVVAEPSDTWSVDVELPADQPEPSVPEGYLRHAVLGMLDVLMTRRERPVVGVHVRIIGIGQDPVRSSPWAFRMAGRAAAEQVLAAA